jgi:uncharacterized membrane protein YsdA (DUF1294 family)
MAFFYAYLVIINALGFIIMRIDKQKARRGHWRIPERTLMTIAAIGGSAGCLAGMYLFRHKTKHLKFKLGIPLILAAQILVAIFVFIGVTALSG